MYSHSSNRRASTTRLIQYILLLSLMHSSFLGLNSLENKLRGECIKSYFEIYIRESNLYSKVSRAIVVIRENTTPT